MRRRSIFLFIGSLSALLLLLSGSSTSASAHASCGISRVAYIPALSKDADPQAIVIDHSHLISAPEKAKNESHHFRLRGLHRNFSMAGYPSTPIKTVPVDAASLTAPPLYNSPDCTYPQHNYLFRLTPF